jgi:hypothetical protein
MSDLKDVAKDLWYGVPLRQAMQDAISRNNTGYSYSELKAAILAGEDLLEDDEIDQVNKTVNLLLRMFVFYHSYSPEEHPNDK